MSNNEKIWDAVFVTVLRVGRLWTPNPAHTPFASRFFAALPDGREAEIEVDPMGHPFEAFIKWRVQRSLTHTGGRGFCLAYYLPDRGWKLKPGLWRSTSRAIRSPSLLA